MKSLRMVIAISCAAGLFGVATPALAQHRGGGHAGGHGAAVSRGGGWAGGHAMSRSYASRGPIVASRFASPRAVVRGGYGGPVFARGGYGRAYGSIVAPVHFFRPYYAFRP